MYGAKTWLAVKSGFWPLFAALFCACGGDDSSCRDSGIFEGICGGDRNQSRTSSSDGRNRGIRPEPSGLVRANLLTKEIEVLASDALGSGPDILTGAVIVLDPDNNRVLVLSRWDERLIAIDLATFERSTVSTEKSSVNAQGMVGGVLDPARGQVVLRGALGDVIEIDLRNGSRRRLLEGPPNATGTSGGIAINPLTSMLYLGPGSTKVGVNPHTPEEVARARRIPTVDLRTGYAGILSEDDVVGEGESIRGLRLIGYDYDEDRCIGWRYVRLLGIGVISIDATTGDRALLFTSGLGRSPDFYLDPIRNRFVYVVEGGPPYVIADLDFATGAVTEHVEFPVDMKIRRQGGAYDADSGWMYVFVPPPES